MSSLICRAYLKLVQFDVYLARGSFQALYDKVRFCPVRGRAISFELIEQVGASVDMACIWYWKQVLCLQRSASTTCLLREHGVPAQMIFGIQYLPFKAHAWVEVDGRVVNDQPHMREKYTVLDRC